MQPNKSTWAATTNRCAENVFVGAVIIPELKLRDVQRQIFTADFVEAADNTAFNQRPKTLNRIGVDRADDVLSDAGGPTTPCG